MQTLQSFCLNRIATSFDRYHYVYSTTKNEDLQGALLFLQRFYSHELVTRLNRGYRLKEKHADFIFNKFLKYMDTDWLTNFSWDGIVNIFERIGPNLESVEFPGDPDRMIRSEIDMHRPWSDVVCHLPQVRTLHSSICNNYFLLRVATYCPKLEKLDIKGSAVTNRGMLFFCKTLRGKKRKRGVDEKEGYVPYPPLKEINAIDTSVSDETIAKVLKHFRSLERLDHASLPRVLHKMHERDLLSLDKVQGYNLTKLDLSGSIARVDTAYYDEILKISVTVCPKLKILLCRVAKWQHLSLISQLTDLVRLELISENPGLEVSDLLKQKGEKLVHLYLNNCNVSLSALGQCCYNLVCMELDNVSLRGSGGDFTDLFSNLKTLHCLDLLDFKALSDILAFSPVLECLFFAYRTPLDLEMRDGILECFGQAVAVNTCFLSDTDFELDFVKEVLLVCPTIQQLSFCARRGLTEVRRFAKTLTGRPRITIYMMQMNSVKTEVEDD